MARAATRKTAKDNGKARTPGAYSLDRFAPPDIYFSIGTSEYRIPGDPDVEVLAQMLRLEREIKGFEDLDEDRTLGDAIVEARDLIVDLIRERDPGFEGGDFRVGVGQVLTLFALISGGESVADVAAAAITAGMSTARDMTPEELEEYVERARRGEDGSPAAPFESTKPSSRRSSQ